MAKTITQLPDATTVGDSDELIVQQSGVTKRATVSELKTQVAALGARDITVSGAARSITNTDNFSLNFGTNNTQRLAITADGDMLLTKTSGTVAFTARMSTDTTAGVNPPIVALERNGTNNGATPNNVDLGQIRFSGRDANGVYMAPAGITAAIGTNAANNAPASLRFDTAASGAAGTTERMRIDASGNVGIGGTANAAAILDVSSTAKGFLPPRMTTAQRDAIATPPAGLMVYNTTTNKLNFYNGTAWEAVTSA